MRTQDLTPQQRRELLAAWDAAVREHRRDIDNCDWRVAYNPEPVSVFFRRFLDYAAFDAVGPAGTSLGY